MKTRTNPIVLFQENISLTTNFTTTTILDDDLSDFELTLDEK